MHNLPFIIFPSIQKTQIVIALYNDLVPTQLNLSFGIHDGTSSEKSNEQGILAYNVHSPPNWLLLWQKGQKITITDAENKIKATQIKSSSNSKYFFE